MNNNSHNKSFLRSLVGKANEICGTFSVKETSYFFSVFYAIVKLKPIDRRDNNFNIEFYQSEIERLSSSFPDLLKSFHRIIAQISDNELNTIYNLIVKSLSPKGICDNNISWIYQFLKKSLEKSAFSKIGENNNKIEGKDLLYTTQFFTDEYMVKYIVDTCVKQYDGRIDNLVFVDSSLGGGNFLTYAFYALYNWYRANTNYTPEQIAELILKNQLIGYDLDENLPEIAKLSLYINMASEIGLFEATPIFYYHGFSDDSLGYLANSIRSNVISGRRFQSHINEIKKSSKSIIYITNPPFMGKRDMETSLKNHLQENFPICKGDLCFSFVYKLLSQLRDNDKLGVVAQNGWMNLSTLKPFRKHLLDNYSIKECVDLGSNAFFAINGEKTNIVLGIFGKGAKDNPQSVFYNLKGITYSEKVEAITSPNILSKVKYIVNQDVFLKNAAYEISYELANSFDSLNSFETYSSFAKTMQGSSTGDNKSFVAYIWEEKTKSKDWIIVSKGGGFSKWQGLNIYKVKWGKNGDAFASNKGSALRNVKEIPYTELVYSDTGTLGLSVRFLLKGQVFIASGPGIKILKGDKYCHIAFLNSTIATCLLKIKNPKFTVSAGYIGQLPVVESIFTSKAIATQAKKMVKYKREFLMYKLPNYEFVHKDYLQIKDIDSYINSCILDDLKNYYLRKKTSDKIDDLVLKSYHFSDTQMTTIRHLIGLPPIVGANIEIRKIDEYISSMLNESCMPSSKRLNGCILGSENPLECASFEFGCNIEMLYKFIKKNINTLTLTRELYRQDLIHKLILEVCKIHDLANVTQITVDCSHVANEIKKKYRYLYDVLSIDSQMVKKVITDLHNKCFYNHPILSCNE